MNAIIGLTIFSCGLALVSLIRKLHRHVRNILSTHEPDPEIRITYYCTKKPPGTGTLPFYGQVFAVDYNERRYVEDIDRMAYGEAVYNRELSHEIMSIFGLIREPQE